MQSQNMDPQNVSPAPTAIKSEQSDRDDGLMQTSSKPPHKLSSDPISVPIEIARRTNLDESVKTSSQTLKELAPTPKKRTSNEAGITEAKGASSKSLGGKGFTTFKHRETHGAIFEPNLLPLLIQPPSARLDERYDANVYVIMHSIMDYDQGAASSSDFARPLWSFSDHGRAEKYMRDYAFRRSEIRTVFQEDYEEKAVLNCLGHQAGNGWGIEMVVRGPGAGPINERPIIGKEIFWLELQHLDLEGEIEGNGLYITITKK